MKKSKLQNEIKPHGLTLKDCGNGHLQVLGGISIVNVYTSAKRGPTMYVQGTSAGQRLHSIQQVINAATKPPKPNGSKAKRSKSYKKVKQRKWKQSKVCHWCKTPFGSLDDTTIDHVIPLSKGGSNGDDNLVLACDQCNSNRKDNVTAHDLQSFR